MAQPLSGLVIVPPRPGTVSAELADQVQACAAARAAGFDEFDFRLPPRPPHCGVRWWGRLRRPVLEGIGRLTLNNARTV